MPLRQTHIFDDLPSRLDLSVNPYVQELMRAPTEAHIPALYGPHLRGMKAKWLEHFAKSEAAESIAPKSLILEIGMHKGQSLLAMAKAHSELAFVGMDITFKRVVSCAQKAKANKLMNVLSVLGDARHVGELFEKSELAGIIAFFPDPWTKKKSQLGNQLFTASFCQALFELLRPGGFFWLKTDSGSYFRSTSQHLEEAGFSLCAQPSGLTAESYESCFEAGFKAKEETTYEGVWLK